MRKHTRFLLPVLLGLAGLLAACSGRGEGEDKVVDIAGIVGSKGGEQVFIGGLARVQEDERLHSELAAKGWTVNFVPVPTSVGGPVVNEGFAAKSIDMAGYGDLPSIIAMSGGVDLRLVLGTGGSNIYLAVGANSPAKSLRDLKGKKIALHRGRPWEAGFARYVESQGLSFDDFTIINTNAVAGTAALTSGKVDAVVLIQAEAYVLQDRGLARILWSTREAPESWKMMAGTFVRQEFADAHPDIVQIVVDAFVRQAHWASLDENRDEVIGWGTLFGAPIEAVRKDSDNSPFSWRERNSPIPHPELQEHFDYVADYAARTSVTRSKVDVSKLIDRQYLDRSLASQNLEGWWKPAGAADRD